MAAARRIVTVALLAFVAVSIVYLIVDELRAVPAGDGTSGSEAVIAADVAGGEGGKPPADAGASPGHKLIAYYFHRTKRCRTCLTIERYAREALEEAFPEAWASGDVVWRTANVDEPVNEHFAKDYALTTSTLVLVDTQDGERTDWRRLDKTWELVRDELEFKAYVEAEAMLYLEMGP